MLLFGAAGIGWQVNAGRKHIGSTDGMQLSVGTSQLLKHRAAHIVPGVIGSMTDAILNRDFERFAELTMKVCLSLSLM